MAEHNQRSLVTADIVEIVARIIRARQDRAAIFGRNLFSDPAWDLMLALFLAQLRQQRLVAAELVNLTSTPLTTAQRWIETLEQKGWIRRLRDPLDHRRILVDLSARGSASMQAWVEDCIGNQLRSCDSRMDDLLMRMDRDRRET